MDTYNRAGFFQAFFKSTNQDSNLKPPANRCFYPYCFLFPECRIFSFTKCGERNSTEKTVNFALLHRHPFFICTHNMQKKILLVWHRQPHKLQTGSCSGSLYGEVGLSVGSKFSLLYYRLCQWRQMPNSGYQKFLCVCPPPTEINGRSLSPSLVRDRLSVLLIVLLICVNSDLWQE